MKKNSNFPLSMAPHDGANGLGFAPTLAERQLLDASHVMVYDKAK